MPNISHTLVEATSDRSDVSNRNAVTRHFMVKLSKSSNNNSRGPASLALIAIGKRPGDKWVASGGKWQVGYVRYIVS